VALGCYPKSLNVFILKKKKRKKATAYYPKYLGGFGTNYLYIYIYILNAENFRKFFFGCRKLKSLFEYSGIFFNFQNGNFKNN